MFYSHLYLKKIWVASLKTQVVECLQAFSTTKLLGINLGSNHMSTRSSLHVVINFDKCNVQDLVTFYKESDCD